MCAVAIPIIRVVVVGHDVLEGSSFNGNPRVAVSCGTKPLTSAANASVGNTDFGASARSRILGKGRNVGANKGNGTVHTGMDDDIRFNGEDIGHGCEFRNRGLIQTSQVDGVLELILVSGVATSLLGKVTHALPRHVFVLSTFDVVSKGDNDTACLNWQVKHHFLDFHSRFSLIGRAGVAARCRSNKRLNKQSKKR